MAFSAGASNVANAVAPLVGGGLIGVEAGVGLGTIAIGIGAFTIARRTMDSVGNDLTELPLLAAMIVMAVGASITTVASALGIPISLALSTVMCIVGLGWGRATRPTAATDIVQGNLEADVSVSAVTAETPADVRKAGEEDPRYVRDATRLFDPSAVARFVVFWIVGPSVATAMSYAAFVVVLSGA
jgi:PiT family inorganic phosphate transporter